MKKTNFLLVIATSCFLFFAFTKMKDEPKSSHQSDGSANVNNLKVITSSQLNANNINHGTEQTVLSTGIPVPVMLVLNGR
ncbi:MAG TPA: hypothetical protein PKA90_06145 [Ignavibacteria bacterium]|nr:hypothetical protein [Ignavibacteria bacterium]HMR39995.1 hypothetical protein [Ignavibacteria bacterium]